ncbi:MAG: hypothetical protein PVI90_18105 [Desulfobacteraceae bacterium]|jgi:aconitase A
MFPPPIIAWILKLIGIIGTAGGVGYVMEYCGPAIKNLANGKPNPDFELNQRCFGGRSILVTRNNFGCGSSREHAVWTLYQDGYKVIIAPIKTIGKKTHFGLC